MSDQSAKDGRRAWRRKQARRVVLRIEETKSWLLNTVQKRKAERAAPVAGAKPHDHGKLTKMQEIRMQLSLNQQMRDDFA
jgi:hypothetical protein